MVRAAPRSGGHRRHRIESYGYEPVIRDVRRALLTQVRYALWFKIEDDAIVVACLHHKRDTRLARERVSRVIELPEREQ